MQREINHRTASNGRIEVSLDWDDQTDELTLTLSDERGTSEWPVPRHEAELAYEHPYAWLGEHPDRSAARTTG